MAAPQPAEVVQSVYAAFGSGDVDRILEACAEPCDWRFVTAAAIPYGGARRSRRDIGEFFAQVAAAEDIAAFEPREVIASGAHVTVLGWERCTPKQGTPYETEWVHVWTVRDGKVVRFRGFYDSAAALEAQR